jgi:hypothetical protein
VHKLPEHSAVTVPCGKQWQQAFAVIRDAMSFGFFSSLMPSPRATIPSLRIARSHFAHRRTEARRFRSRTLTVSAVGKGLRRVVHLLVISVHKMNMQ